MRARNAIAAATVWLPSAVFIATLVAWWGRLPTDVVFRNDLHGQAAAVFPTWVIAAGIGFVLVGVGIGAISVVPEGPNGTESRRVPLFWAGAVAGVVCAVWIFQAWFALSPPDYRSGANALAGFATIAAALYGLVPFFVADRPQRRHLV